MNVKNVSECVNVSIKTEKVSGKLMIHITVHEVITRINQLKGIYFPKVPEIVVLMSCQNSDIIPVMCVPKGN